MDDISSWDWVVWKLMHVDKVDARSRCVKSKESDGWLAYVFKCSLFCAYGIAIFRTAVWLQSPRSVPGRRSTRNRLAPRAASS